MSKLFWKQERPDFCPHGDCRFIFRVLDSMCGGELPNPEPHNGDYNTHRFCLNGISKDGDVFDLQINEADAGWFRMMFNAMFPPDADEVELLETLVLYHGHLPSCPQFTGPYDLGELEPACACGYIEKEIENV